MSLRSQSGFRYARSAGWQRSQSGFRLRTAVARVGKCPGDASPGKAPHVASPASFGREARAWVRDSSGRRPGRFQPRVAREPHPQPTSCRHAEDV